MESEGWRMKFLGLMMKGDGRGMIGGELKTLKDFPHYFKVKSEKYSPLKVCGSYVYECS